MIWSDSARDLRMENMMSCLRNDDTFSICNDSAKFSNSAGVLVFSSARCIVVSRSLSWMFSHGNDFPEWARDGCPEGHGTRVPNGHVTSVPKGALPAV